MGWLLSRAAGKRGQVMDLEVGRCIGDKRKAGGVGLRKAVHGEGTDALDDALLGIGGRCRCGSCRSRRRAFQVFHALAWSGACRRRGAASSASAPEKLATVMAMRSSCSWKSGTPRVRFRTGSREGCG